MRNNYLSYLNPIKLTFLGFFIWFLVFITSPLEININLNLESVIFVIINILAFIIGAAVVRNKKVAKNVLPTISKEKNFFLFFIIVGTVGFLIKIYDKFFIRHLQIGEGIIENRELLDLSSGGFLSIISGALSPFSLIPLFLLMKYRFKVNHFFKVYSYFLFSIYSIDSILLGNRSAIFVMILLYFSYHSYSENLRFRFRVILRYLGLSVFVISIFGLLFLSRSKEIFGDEIDVYGFMLEESAYNFTIKPKDDFLSYFDGLPTPGKFVTFTYVNTVQYFTHGLFEFTYLYDKFDGEHSYGSRTFWIFDRLICFVLNNEYSITSIENLSPRVGIYESFFGSIYIDFGWFSPIFMLILGIAAKKFYVLSYKNFDSAILVTFYFTIVILFFPVFNFIEGSGGIFILTAFLIYFCLEIIAKMNLFE